jgi:hypothetical protein
MTSARQALHTVSDLHVEYCPILDKLLSATGDNVDEVVANEQRLGERIWDEGKKAFGKIDGNRLHMFNPFSEEEKQFLDQLYSQRVWLSDEHWRAAQGCFVRSARLGRYIDEAEGETTPPEMPKRIGGNRSQKFNDDPFVELARQIKKDKGIPAAAAVREACKKLDKAPDGSGALENKQKRIARKV